VEFSHVTVPSQVLSEKYKTKNFRPPKGYRTANINRNIYN
jgi:hypothetical protein